jgi:hypothetical protein
MKQESLKKIFDNTESLQRFFISINLAFPSYHAAQLGCIHAAKQSWHDRLCSTSRSIFPSHELFEVLPVL